MREIGPLATAIDRLDAQGYVNVDRQTSAAELCLQMAADEALGTGDEDRSSHAGDPSSRPMQSCLSDAPRAALVAAGALVLKSPRYDDVDIRRAAGQLGSGLRRGVGRKRGNRALLPGR